MVFSSSIFVFIFLPVVLLCYYLIPKRFRAGRNTVLLIFSLFFYFFGEPRGILLMIASVLVNYLSSLFIDRHRSNLSARRAALIIALMFNLGTLGFYKYTGFLLYNIERIFNMKLYFPEVIMPIGISFFTFQGLSYVFDVYKGDVPAQRNPLNVALYISMFPQLVAGPIVRYEDIELEIGTRDENRSDFSAGIRRFVYGLAKKMLLANTMGTLSAEIAHMDHDSLQWGVAWLGAIAYTFQIYYDFSGYSDMAIGMGHMFGFKFLENFNYPYISRSVTEFWRRWHMTLSVWFRDYVYIPLGGNRCSTPRQIFNIIVVWGLTGLWHGASWNFVVWGLYFAVLLILEKFVYGKLLERIPRIFSHIYTLFIVVIGWVIFSTELGMGAVFQNLYSLLPRYKMSVDSANYVLFSLRLYRTEFIAAAVFSTPVAKYIAERFETHYAYQLARLVCVCALFVLSLLAIISTTFNPFIYFRF